MTTAARDLRPARPTAALPAPWSLPGPEVLRAVAAEIVVEAAEVAAETATANPAAQALVTSLFGEPGSLSHEELKARSAGAALIIRTGEATPYANVLLRCGVPF